MMKQIHKLFFLLISFSFIVISCKKTDLNNNNNNNNNKTPSICALKKVVHKDSSYTFYTFDLDSNLTKIEDYDSAGIELTKYFFYYSGKKLTKAEIRENGMVRERYDFHYPSGSSIPDSAIIFVDMGGSSLEKTTSLALTFNSSNQITKVEDIIYGMGSSMVVSRTAFTYTNDNCTNREIYFLDFNTQQLALEEYTTYEYDQMKNPYFGIGIDYYFAIIEDKPPYTKNNINKSRNYDKNNQLNNENSLDYGYEYNIINYPTEQIKANLSGTEQKINLFKYNCQ